MKHSPLPPSVPQATALVEKLAADAKSRSRDKSSDMIVVPGRADMDMSAVVHAITNVYTYPIVVPEARLIEMQEQLSGVFDQLPRLFREARRGTALGLVERLDFRKLVLQAGLAS